MRVIKVGGRARRDPRLAPLLAAEWTRAPGALCIVHGGGDDVSALQRRLGVETVFVGGRRRTSREDLELLRMVLSGAANKGLVASLLDAGATAVGVSGEDAALLLASRTDSLLGHVGSPTRANVGLIRALAAAGYLPVVSPLARDVSTGGALNVNADDAAALLAAALGARELLLLSDVPAVMRSGLPCDTLDAQEVRSLISSKEATEGMAPKLEAALAALERGVATVRIGDLDAIECSSSGTTILAGAPVTA